MTESKETKNQPERGEEIRDMQECLSCLQNLHKLQGAMLARMNKRLSQRILDDDLHKFIQKYFK